MQGDFLTHLLKFWNRLRSFGPSLYHSLTSSPSFGPNVWRQHSATFHKWKRGGLRWRPAREGTGIPNAASTPAGLYFHFPPGLSDTLDSRTMFRQQPRGKGNFCRVLSRDALLLKSPISPRPRGGIRGWASPGGGATRLRPESQIDSQSEVLTNNIQSVIATAVWTRPGPKSTRDDDSRFTMKFSFMAIIAIANPQHERGSNGYSIPVGKGKRHDYSSMWHDACGPGLEAYRPAYCSACGC
ncbi:hypothetical protein JTE90_001966 [Oedothorax gibbosus]|uniref:Uncharacterized protein n=1 Tax=Oedothorax gibbosus TaxID=931172 RepID=A0AAV6TIQ0_9ARAC|nr:hypothetical protein JTE90_001966 [Oedothorax gibbosus]